MFTPDIEIRNGEAVTLDVTCFTDISLLDITSLDLRFYVKRNELILDSNALITKTVGDGITIVDGEAGQATISINSSDTQLLSNEITHKFYWVLKVYITVTENYVWDSGTFKIISA